MNAAIDINADLGEGFADDARLLDLVTSASISCGAHAGDRATILATLQAAKTRGVPVGAHPGYPDREGFGRHELNLPAAQIICLIIGQFKKLGEIASEVGVALRFVKPHGALYNQAQRDEVVAMSVINAMIELGLPLLGQPGTVLERLAKERGVPFISEGFPDRRYDSDGRLVPRSIPDAILHDDAEMAAQVVRFVQQGISTLCVHGDDPDAVANAERVRRILKNRRVEPRFWAWEEPA